MVARQLLSSRCPAAWRIARPPPSPAAHAPPVRRRPSAHRPAEAQRQDGDIVALPKHPSATQRHHLAALRQTSRRPGRGADSAVRSADHRLSMAVLRESSASSASSDGAISMNPGRHPDRGQIERPRVRRPVVPHRPGPVQREPHRQRLDRHVMHHLVVGALQERRVDRAERLHPLGRQSRGARLTACALVITDVERGSGKCRRNRSSPAPDGIAAVIATMAAIASPRQSTPRRTPWCRRAARRCLRLLAGDQVELRHAVQFCRPRPQRARSPCPSG